MNNFHKPVLLKEVIEFLRIKSGKKYIDATLGGGGHGVEILKKGGVLLGIDVDKEALEFVKRRWKMEAGRWNITEGNLVLARGNFREIDQLAHLQGFDRVSGIIFDLGVSSHQLDSGTRGFSFNEDAPLDMRMDQSGKSGQVTAADLINGLNKGELYELFSQLGEEKRAFAIVSAVLRARSLKKIETTKELADLVAKVYGRGYFNIHPATKVFQALRIAVNSELESLRIALPKAVALLETKGRLAVISFHSLEDRIVKENFKEFEEEGLGKILTKKPVEPSFREIEMNRRARSAKLRVFEKN